MKEEKLFKELKKHLDSGKLKMRYIDPLKSYIKFEIKDAGNIIALKPNSTKSGLFDAAMDGVKKSDKEEDRKFWADVLMKLVNYRRKYTGSLGDTKE